MVGKPGASMSDALEIQSNIHFAGQKWLRTFREQQLNKFLQRGFPTRREEQWKYTDVTHLKKMSYVENQQTNSIHPIPLAMSDAIFLVFIDGYFAAQLSDITLLPKQVLLCSLQQALKSHENLIKPYLTREFDEKQYPFACLNSALLSDGMFLQVPKNISVSAPIQCVYLNTAEKNTVSCPRNIIHVEENSQITIIEEYVGETGNHYFTNAVSEIYAENNARVYYHKIQNESSEATHIANLFLHQKQDSQVKTHTLAVGANLAREDVHVDLRERGAECSLNGFYCLTRDNQHIDSHIHVDHRAAQGKSRMLYKGILDKKSHAVFNGKVFVHKNAQQNNAHQANHNLLLSSLAEINTKPELEIYADDVKCTHGATVGQLDAESLFYLRSRGIKQNEALRLLTYAFAGEVIDHITDKMIQAHVNTILNEKLSCLTVEDK